MTKRRGPYTLVAELTYRCPLALRLLLEPAGLARHAAELDTAAWRRVFARRGGAGRAAGEPDRRRAAGARRSRGAGRGGARAAALRQPDHQRHPRRPRAAGGAGGRGPRQRPAVGAGRRPARRGLDRRARRSRAQAGGRGRGARARPAADAQRGHPPRQHRARGRSSSRWPSASAPSAWSWRTRSTSAGRWPTATRCCRRAPTSSRRAPWPPPRAERLRGKIEILFVRPDYYADRPRACMDGWARRYIVVTPDGLVLPCHQAREHHRAGLRERPRSAAGARSGAIRRRCARSAAKTGCRRRAAPATSATRDFGGCRCQAFALVGDAGATDPACALSPRHDIVPRRPRPRRRLRPRRPPPRRPRSACAGCARTHERASSRLRTSPRRTATSRQCAASASRSARARSSASSGRTARARPPRSRSCARCCSRRRGGRGWLGMDVTTSPGDVRRRIGVIFQDPALDDRLTAEENLMLHAVAYRVPRGERAGRIAEALRFVDLHERAQRPDPHLLGRHEAPPGDRARPDPPPRDPVPRRADHRASIRRRARAPGRCCGRCAATSARRCS